MSDFKPLNLAQIYASADSGVAQAMQMNIMALQGARMKDEYDREDALRSLASNYVRTDPATGETSMDMKGFTSAAMGKDPLKAMAFTKATGDAEKAALEREKLRADITESRARTDKHYRENWESAQQALGAASLVPLLKYKELIAKGVPDAEARKQVQPFHEAGVQTLLARFPKGGAFAGVDGQIVPFDIPKEFDPTKAEVGIRQLQGVTKVMDEYLAGTQPKSDLGKLKADFDAGRIDKKTYEAAVAKAVDGSDWRYDSERGVIVNTKTAETKAVGAPSASPGGQLPPKGSDVEGLRKEFNNRQEVQNYNAAVPVLRSIANAPDTGAGDLDLIYGVGKILDPGSVVREGEMALTIKTGSPLERLMGVARFSVEGGGRLTASQREKLVTAMQGRVTELHQAATDARKPFETQAKRQGIPVEETLTLPELPKVGGKNAKKPTTFDAMPEAAQYSGRRIRGEDGSTYRSNGKEWVKE